MCGIPVPKQYIGSRGVPGDIAIDGYELTSSHRLLPSTTLVFLAVTIAMLVSGWEILLSGSLSSGLGQDFTHNYVAAWAIVHGYSAYTSNAPVAHYAASLHLPYCVAIELPVVELLCYPFLLFSVRVALVLYTALQYLFVVAGAVCMARTVDRSNRLLVVAAMVASPAAFLLGYYGQLGAGVFVFSAVGLWARFNRRWLILGFCIAAAIFVKPQLGMCAALPLAWGAPRPTWKAFAGTVAGFSALTGAILGPHGVLDYYQALRAFSTSPQVTANGEGLGISSLYRSWLPGQWTPGLTASLDIVIVTCICLLFYRYGRSPSNAAVALLTFSLVLLLPYSHQYDAIILFPAMFLAWTAVGKDGKAHAGLLVGYALIYVTPLMAISAYRFNFRLLALGLLLCVPALLRSGDTAPRCAVVPETVAGLLAS